MADRDLEAELKKHRVSWWFAFVVVQEAAKSVRENNLSALEVDMPLQADGLLSVKVRG